MYLYKTSIKDSLQFYNYYNNKWETIVNNDNPSFRSSKLKKTSKKDNYKISSKAIIKAEKFGVSEKNRDNSAALQKAIDYCTRNNKKLFISNGTYFLQDLKITCSIIGEEQTTLKLLKKTKNHLAEITTKGDIIIQNIIFDGNRTQQEAPELMENTEGLSLYSLVQIKEGFNEITIEDCRFENSIQGGINLMDKADYPQQGNMNINRCLFQNLRTEGIRYYRNPQCLIQKTKKKLVGKFVIDNSSFKDIGIRLDVAVRGKKNYGNAIAVGYLSKLEVKHCNFDNVARFNVKTGVIDYINLFSNAILNSSWGHLQTQSHPIGVPYEAEGKISVSNELYVHNAANEKSLFVQLKGSLLKDANHSVFPEVEISNCRIFYLNQKNNLLSDCIQTSSLGKYRNIIIKDNYCFGVRRGFVGIGLPVQDNFKIQSLSIENNTIVGRGKTATTANSLLYTQTPSGKPIENISIKNNQVSQVQSSLYLECDPVKNIVIENNKFDNLHKYSIFFVNGNKRLKKKKVIGNKMSGQFFEKN
jgi:hypothetical protein